MHTTTPSEEENSTKHTMETVAKLFHTMALESNIEHTYHMFNTKTFRESLGISSLIWGKLVPPIKDRINEIRAGIKAKCDISNPSPAKHESSKPYPPKNDKMPNQYPTMKSTVANLVNSLADLTVDSDNDTDNEAMDVKTYMTKT